MGEKQKPTTTLLSRKAGYTSIRDLDGNKVEYPLLLDDNESVLSQLREPHQFPELFNLREEIRGWRFYHTFRTDSEAPLRVPRVSVRTPVLSHDGHDLAAALQTIFEMGNGDQLMEVIEAALPGRQLSIYANESNQLSKSPQCTELGIALYTDGCSRPLLARELSDGTLKFLCLAAALLSPRPSTMIALNEPETSLHPDLLRPLAELIVRASELSQVWVSTHSQILVESMSALTGVRPIRLGLEHGETVIQD